MKSLFLHAYFYMTITLSYFDGPFRCFLGYQSKTIMKSLFLHAYFYMTITLSYFDGPFRCFPGYQSF